MKKHAPKSEDGYFIPTLNKMGYSTTQLDPYTAEFVNFCSDKTTALEQKSAGLPFPGFIEDTQQVASARDASLPKQVHWSDPTF